VLFRSSRDERAKRDCNAEVKLKHHVDRTHVRHCRHLHYII